MILSVTGLDGRSISEVSMLISEVFARKKYRLLKEEFDLLVPPKPTMIKQIKEAMVRAIGVKIHAKRPAFPMMAVVKWFLRLKLLLTKVVLSV